MQLGGPLTELIAEGSFATSLETSVASPLAVQCFIFLSFALLQPLSLFSCRILASNPVRRASLRPLHDRLLATPLTQDLREAPAADQSIPAFPSCAALPPLVLPPLYCTSLPPFQLARHITEKQASNGCLVLPSNHSRPKSYSRLEGV